MSGSFALQHCTHGNTHPGAGQASPCQGGEERGESEALRSSDPWWVRMSMRRGGCQGRGPHHSLAHQAFPRHIAAVYMAALFLATASRINASSQKGPPLHSQPKHRGRCALLLFSGVWDTNMVPLLQGTRVRGSSTVSSHMKCLVEDPRQEQLHLQILGSQKNTCIQRNTIFSVMMNYIPSSFD